MDIGSGVEGLIKSGLKSIAASVPVAASISQAWNEYESHLQSKRVEQFFQLLRPEIARVKERIKLVEDHVRQSGEVPSLIEQTIDKIRKENSERKRQTFAHLLANSVAAGPTLQQDDKLTFIDTLDTLTGQEISLLSIFQPDLRIRVNEIAKNSIFDDILYEKRLGKLAVSLKKLESRGLISETIGPGDISVMSVSYDTEGWEEKFEKKYFELLPHGQLFYQMILGEGI